MSTSPDVNQQVILLARAIFNAWQEAGTELGVYDPTGSAKTSAWLARILVREGWRKTNQTVPRCPNGNPICFDPEPHDRCPALTR